MEVGAFLWDESICTSYLGTSGLFVFVVFGCDLGCFFFGCLMLCDVFCLFFLCFLFVVVV